MEQDPASGATAAAWLNQFRASPAPYEVCRYVLVQHAASSDVAKFQAAGALRDAALREWATLSPDTKRSLVRCLFEAAQLSAGAQVVLGSATAAAAALLKRLWGETGAAERQALIGEVEALAAAAPVAALALMTAIVVEFSPTTASAMGMPWDYHDRCRRDLLDGYVLLFLQRGLQAARATAAAAAADGDGGICLASVRLVTAALSWDFDSSASWASPQGQRPGDGGLAVKPPASWQGALLGEGAWDWLPVGVLTSNHPAGSALREALWQLVVQLCCLDGQVFAAPAGGRHGPGAPRTKHLSTMLAVLLPALSLELSSSVADILLHSSQAVLALARSHRLGGFLAVASAGEPSSAEGGGDDARRCFHAAGDLTASPNSNSDSWVLCLRALRSRQRVCPGNSGQARAACASLQRPRRRRLGGRRWRRPARGLHRAAGPTDGSVGRGDRLRFRRV